MAFPFGAWTLPTFVPLLLHADDVENSMEHRRMLLPEMVTEQDIWFSSRKRNMKPKIVFSQGQLICAPQ
jgi:hypothetical protein